MEIMGQSLKVKGIFIWMLNVESNIGMPTQGHFIRDSVKAMRTWLEE